MKKRIALLIALLLCASLCTFASAEEPVELIWWMGTNADAPIDQQMVEDALNEITAKELGITIKCTYMTNDQMTLAISSGEYFDMCFTSNGWYNDYATNALAGVYLNIDGMVQEQTPALYESMPQLLWDGAYINVEGQNGLYAVPVMKDYGIEIYWIIDIDYFATEKGMEIPTEMGFADIEPFLAAYKEDFPEQYPMMFSKEGPTSWSNFLDWVHQDAMISLSYNDMGTENEGKVRLCFEMPEFIERIETIHSWYEKGYINPDAAVVESISRAASGVVQSGQGFYGADSIWSNARQKASAISRYDGPYMSCYSVRGSSTAISAASKHPEEALRLIEYANTNKEYRNMLRYGLEDVHYTWNEDTTITKTKQGQDNYSPWAYTQASYALSAVEASPFPSVPADPNMWQVIWDGYADATNSVAIGFTFDYQPVEMQVNAVKAIKEMYWYEMQTGTSDPAEMFPKIIEELEDAGIREIIEEAQTQLDAFLETKKGA